MASLVKRYGEELPPSKDESEADYRERCAVMVATKYKDFVEAHEIRTTKGWNQWNEAEKTDLLRRGLR
jgi:hypothetical protein